MHELSVTQNILDLVLKHGRANNARRIDHIYLVIGELSSIVDDSVRFYWEMIAKDTIAEHAELHFNRVRAEFLCDDCQQQYAMTEDLVCPQCKGSHVRVVTGEQFYLEAIDVEMGGN